MENNYSQRKIAAFMPSFDIFGETYPFIEIAKKFEEYGGNPIFVGRRDRYTNLVERLGFKLVELNVDFPEKLSKKVNKVYHDYFYQKKNQEKLYSKFLFCKELEKTNIEMIEQEMEIFKNEEVDIVITGYNFFTPLISSRAANIPLVFLTYGTAIPPYFKANNATFPTDYENIFTRLIPQKLKDYLTNRYILKCKWGVKGFNRLAKKYGVKRARCFLDLLSGDHTFVAASMKFLDVQPSPRFPDRNYVGPIVPGKYFNRGDNTSIENIKNFVKKPGKSILVSMGSSGAKSIFIEILHALNKTNYNVIAIYTSILDEEMLPKFGGNMLLKKFVPSILELNKMVDLAVIHGGQGTVYNAAYSGKPAVGIPMFSEQQFNLDNLVRHGSGIRLSKKYFQKEKFIKTIREIFANYDFYLKNAKLLKETLPKSEGAKNAAVRLLEIIKAGS